MFDAKEEKASFKLENESQWNIRHYNYNWMSRLLYTLPITDRCYLKSCNYNEKKVKRIPPNVSINIE